ncbi:Hypothetical protein PHPALM_9152 [Phytophthora palmivora]|uniref:Uncharacterized protein n=1 Tax=Phytophthora palmivora TaxID=4796 RepID=A0A2P4Y810_9STRA|nr:Hypothetical protein PHPALM_9152 [Phytophthora palmivora]
MVAVVTSSSQKAPSAASSGDADQEVNPDTDLEDAPNVVESTAPAGLTSPSGRPLRTAAATARQVNAQLLENLETSDTLALGLGDGSSGAVATQPSSSGSVSHPLELSSDSADDDQPSAADLAVGSSTAASDAPAEPISTTPKFSRLAQLFGSENESDSGNSGDSDSTDGPLTPVVTSSDPPQDKVQSYLAAGQLSPGPPPASASAGLSYTSPSPTKKHRKGKKKHKHKHKHKAKAAHKGRHKSKREDRHKGRCKETKSQAKRPRSPSPGEPSASDAGAPLKKHKVSTRSPAAANSATDSAAGPEPSPNLAGGSGPSSNSTGMILPSQLRVSIAVLRTRAMQSASRDSRITPQLARLRDLPFFHVGSRRCWLKILGHQSGRVPMEPHGDGLGSG